jgi:hypothetical protein
VLALAPDPGGVDQDERAVVAPKDGVDRVARRPRHVRDDHPLPPEQRVQERRLADVRAAEDRDSHRVLARRLHPRARQPRDDLVEQLAGAVPVQRRERQRVAEPQPVELERVRVAPRVVDLVRDDEHRLARGAQDGGDLLVAGRDPRARVDHEDDHVRLGHGLARLVRDRPGDRRRIGHVHTARVHEEEPLAGPVADELLAVAGHAGRLVHDGRTALREPVHERRLADVRKADDCNRAGERRFERLRPLGHAGGTATGRPSACTSARKSNSRRISRWISAEASR